ncbi:ABC transporter ATP-binding protein [Brevibacterium salitolerans]|uniref:ABC transporter domain-containing protein n=1 Tax=Brevibacterium salitolerans TaxID=1403566 RepID=A0ABN2WTU3_9MICO
MLALSDVTLTFPDGASRVTAVHRASLTVPSGTITGVTGPSGSGKSSLLALASTLVTPDSGSVSIAGIRTTGLSPAETAALRREKVGIVFQQANLLPSLTAAEQVRVMAELTPASGADGRARHGRSGEERHNRNSERNGESGERHGRGNGLGRGCGSRSSQEDGRERGRGAGRRARRTRAEELLELVGLADHRRARPHALSGGQQQRVNIARALMCEPDVLIVDEPTSALDSARSREIVELLLEVTRTLGTATLLVTHDVEFLPLFDRTLTMTDGELRAERPLMSHSTSTNGPFTDVE